MLTTSLDLLLLLLSSRGARREECRARIVPCRSVLACPILAQTLFFSFSFFLFSFPVYEYSHAQCSSNAQAHNPSHSFHMDDGCVSLLSCSM